MSSLQWSLCGSPVLLRLCLALGNDEDDYVTFVVVALLLPYWYCHILDWGGNIHCGRRAY